MKRKPGAVPDRRSKLDLELFLLALLERDVITPYAMQQVGSISQGAALPCLRRLVDQGMASQGDKKARRRTDYCITAAGKKHLRSNWRRLLKQDPPSDIDSVIRILALSTMMGAARRPIAEFARKAAAQRSILVKVKDRDVHPVPPSGAPETLRWMKIWAEKGRLTAESEILTAIALRIRR